MEILQKLNSIPLYLISGVIILYVVGFALLILVRAYKAGKAIGMDEKKLKQTVTASATFTLIPSISILLGVIALSGSLGIPLPWLRLSVIGALHYETSVADIAARNSGLTGLNASEMTVTAFTTIALLMAIGIIWGCVLMVLFGKKYSQKLTKNTGSKKEKRSFADHAMTAMFIGLISAYIGSYVAEFVQMKEGSLVCTGNYLQLVTLAASALAMAVFLYFSEKKKNQWIENFSMAGAMIVGMAAAVICGLL